MKPLIIVALMGASALANAAGILSTSTDAEGTSLQLSDVSIPLRSGGVCKAAVGVSPTGGEHVPACWTASGGIVHVDYLLAEGVAWSDDVPESEFRLTPYGLAQHGGGL